MNTIQYPINNEKYYKEYKKIKKTCLLNGYALPQYLSEIHIPKEYNYTYEESVQLNKQITEENLEKLGKTYKTRRRKDKEICHIKNRLKQDNLITDIYNLELKEFFNRFPQFKNILTIKIL